MFNILKRKYNHCHNLEEYRRDYHKCVAIAKSAKTANHLMKAYKCNKFFYKKWLDKVEYKDLYKRRKELNTLCGF